MNIINNLSKKITQVSQDTVKKTKDFTEISQKKIQIAETEKELQKLYMTLGEVYFNNFASEPAAPLSGICSSINNLLEKINGINSEIEAIKTANVCPKCGEKVEDDSMFCTNCGMKLKEE